MESWLYPIIILAVASFSLYQFFRSRRPHSLLLSLLALSMLLAYVPAIGESSAGRLALAIGQAVLFILLVFFLFRRDPKQRAAARAALDASQSPESAEPSAADDPQPPEPNP